MMQLKRELAALSGFMKTWHSSLSNYHLSRQGASTFRSSDVFGQHNYNYRVLHFDENPVTDSLNSLAQSPGEKMLKLC